MARATKPPKRFPRPETVSSAVHALEGAGAAVVFVDGKPIRKTIYVQDRLLNFVV